ncbi:MAG: magnesium transporter MgtC [Parcubacteria group bacterium]|nr:magnesium transporter MgtC [Parcubacteria group bacterium]|tara:strand:- start:2699 stop:3115 length:417 start_codon:yes stop_codon:yes gene_type:complete
MLTVSEIIIRLVVATILCTLFGLEREQKHKEAGLRTNVLVGLGSALIMIVSLSFDFDPARIAAGIVTGIGFLGAGVIIHDRKEIHNITTAATIWMVAAVGMAVGLGYYTAAITASVISLVFLYVIGNPKIRKVTKLDN